MRERRKTETMRREIVSNPLEFSSMSITLPDFIRSEQRKHKSATGELTNILLCIALGTKIVSRGVNAAGLAKLLGLTGEKNIQGEDVQKLDVYADTVFASVLGRSGEILSMVSEEREKLFAVSGGDGSSKYVIAFDPLDGSSNIDVNVSIGTIWGIYKRKSKGSSVNPDDTSDFLQASTSQVATGYAIYGSSTMFVFTVGEGVYGFTLDPTIGEFILTHPKMQLPKVGKIYSCNEAYSVDWLPGYKTWLKHAKEAGDGSDNRPYSQRYVGSLVADFHRTMLKGGVFLYPADSRNTNGKLRVLYECNPLALIAEAAGGKASSGSGPILSIVPEKIHQRTPLIIGSTSMVEELERFVRDGAQG